MAQKGKQGTKGQKQIIEENISTLRFYQNMIIVCLAFYFVCVMFLFNAIPALDITLTVWGGIVFGSSYYFMAYMAKMRKSDSGAIIDEGTDLNMEGGLAEHVKDLIILTSACVICSTYSTYFWLIWLFAPARAFHIAWKHIIAPWIFAEPPQEEEMSDKKKRKMERKMKRNY